MGTKKAIKLLHLASTIWFMVCTGYIFTLAMHQAGFNWFVIFSLSGHWALIIILLVSLYLFIIFRGTDPGLNMQAEHPLTSTPYYMMFYSLTPFLGAIAGILGILGETRIGTLLGGIALGTIGATFLTWVIIDPITGFFEVLTPGPKKQRSLRIASAMQQKRFEQETRKQKLDSLFEMERENERMWREEFMPQAQRLAMLLKCDVNDFSKAEQEAIRIGVEAWKKGGLICMRYLRNMAIEIFKEQYGEEMLIDYISGWWDGIGRWRNPALAVK